MRRKIRKIDLLFGSKVNCTEAMTSDLKLTLAQLRFEMEEYLNLDSNDTFAKIEQGYDNRRFGACINIRKSYRMYSY